jgi:phosphohistidine phosphatase
MELYLISHGIAEEHQPALKDEERKLTKEGREKTEKVASRLLKLDLNFDLILTSPLVRAHEIAEILIAVGLCSQLEISHHLTFEGNIKNWLTNCLEPRNYT